MGKKKVVSSPIGGSSVRLTNNAAMGVNKVGGRNAGASIGQLLAGGPRTAMFLGGLAQAVAPNTIGAKLGEFGYQFGSQELYKDVVAKLLAGEDPSKIDMSGLTPEQVNSAIALKSQASKARFEDVQSVVKLAKDITALDIPEDVRSSLLDNLYKAAGFEEGDVAKYISKGKSPLQQQKELLEEKTKAEKSIIERRGEVEGELTRMRGDIEKDIAKIRAGATVEAAKIRNMGYNKETADTIARLREELKSKYTDRVIGSALAITKLLTDSNDDLGPDDRSSIFIKVVRAIDPDMYEKFRQLTSKEVESGGEDELSKLAEEAGVELKDVFDIDKEEGQLPQF